MLPATPTTSNRFAMSCLDESSTNSGTHRLATSPGVVFAKRKRSPFKGAMLNSSALQNGAAAAFEGPGNGNLGSPAVFSRQSNTGLLDGNGTRRAKATQRKSLIITEEEEEEEEEAASRGVAQAMARVHDDEHDGTNDDDDDDNDNDDEGSIEEVDHFTPIHLNRGESVHSILFFDDPGLNDETRYISEGLRSAFHTQPSTPAYEVDRQLEKHIEAEASGRLSPADAPQLEQPRRIKAPKIRINPDASSSLGQYNTDLSRFQSRDPIDTQSTTSTVQTTDRTTPRSSPLREKSDNAGNFPVIPTRTSSGQLKTAGAYSYYAAAIAHEAAR